MKAKTAAEIGITIIAMTDKNAIATTAMIKVKKA
jgi:hypothetical protein